MAKTYKRLDTPIQTHFTNPSVRQLEDDFQIRKSKKFINGNRALIITDARTGEQTAGQVGAFIWTWIKSIQIGLFNDAGKTKC